MNYTVTETNRKIREMEQCLRTVNVHLSHSTSGSVSTLTFLGFLAFLFLFILVPILYAIILALSSLLLSHILSINLSTFYLPSIPLACSRAHIPSNFHLAKRQKGKSENGIKEHWRKSLMNLCGITNTDTYNTYMI